MLPVKGRIVCLFSKNAKSISPLFKQAAPSANVGVRNLTSDKSVYKKRWAYEKKGFYWYHGIYDFTTSRLNQNSRIICIEGPPYVGKTDFGKAFAEEFNLLYMGQVTEDDVFDVNGLDIRLLNDQFKSKKLKYVGLDTYYNEPDPTKAYNIGMTQLSWFQKKFTKYAEACAHMLSTGQGVILESSVFTDMLYANLLYQNKYFTRNGYAWYRNHYRDVIRYLWRPHLVIHLDAPLSYIMDQIKKKKPNHYNSHIMTEKYVEKIQKAYWDYLKQMHVHSEVLSYDVTDMPDFDLLALDFERLDLIEEVEGSDLRFDDWRRDSEESYSNFRNFVTDPEKIEDVCNPGDPWDCPELLWSVPEEEEYVEVTDRIPQFKNEYDSKQQQLNPYVLNPMLDAAEVLRTKEDVSFLSGSDFQLGR